MSEIKTVIRWDELPPVTYSHPGTGAQAYSTRILEKRARDYYKIAKALHEYISTIPEHIKLELDLGYVHGSMSEADLKRAEEILSNAQ
jgi:hypothetical protein